MSDLLFEKFRQDENKKIKISGITGLNLTYFLQVFVKVNLQTLLLSSEYCAIYQNLQKIILVIKSFIVGHLSITTFLG